MTAARPDTWMPLYCGDYLKDTGHLSTAEHGAYVLLLIHYWTTGAPLADDDEELRRITRMDKPQWRASGQRLRRFFRSDAGRLHHKRADLELAKALGKVEKRSKAGSKGAEVRWQSHGNAIAEPLADASQTDGPSPSPSPKEDSEATASAGREPAVVTPLDLKRQLWATGRAFLGSHGITEDRAGSLIGKWLKALGGGNGAQTTLLTILASAEANCQGNLIEYVEASIERHHHGRVDDGEDRTGFGAAVAAARAVASGG